MKKTSGCGGHKADMNASSPDGCCLPQLVGHRREAADPSEPLAWFADMISNCLEYARSSKAQGRLIVGILCEYTPRELIMAAGGIPVCLCGGSAEMIGPAEEDLPAIVCPLIKSTYGYHKQRANPFLEMADLLVAETTCDGKKKMYELMAKTRPFYVLELPQKPSDADAKAHWVSELRKLKAELERRFGVLITDDKLREAIRLMNRERQLRRQLAQSMKADPPPLTGRQLLDCKSIISGNPADLDHYTEVIEWLRSKRAGGPDADKVRVLLTGVPTVHGAERVVDLIEGHGGLIVCMENCTGLKPILEDVDEQSPDPIVALAEKYLHLPCSVMTPNDRRMESLRELAAGYRPECIVELVWQGCLTYDVESHQVKGLAAELALPYLRVVTDYSPSDSARIAVRVEALFEAVRPGPGGRKGCRCSR